MIGGVKDQKVTKMREKEIGGRREAEGGGKEGEGIGGGGVSSGRKDSVSVVAEIAKRKESIRIENRRKDSVKEAEGLMGEGDEEARRIAGRLMESGMGVRELVEERVEMDKLAEIS